MKTQPILKAGNLRSVLFPFLFLFLFVITQLNAQPGGGGNGGRPPKPNLDSIFRAHWTDRDSIIIAHHHDSLPPVVWHDSTLGHHLDSIIHKGRPPHQKPFPDTTGHDRDTSEHHPGGPHPPFPGPGPRPTPPPFPKDTIIHRDTTHHNWPPVPPLPKDTTHRDDTSHHNWPPFPPMPPDTGKHPEPPFPPHDTSGHNNPPPFPKDTTDNDDTSTTGGTPHHRIMYIETNAKASINIYPNPMVSNSTILIENASDVVTLRLYEVSGRMVQQKTNLSNGTYTLSKENLSPGIYVYEMLDGNTIASTGRVVIY